MSDVYFPSFAPEINFLITQIIPYSLQLSSL